MDEAEFHRWVEERENKIKNCSHLWTDSDPYFLVRGLVVCYECGHVEFRKNIPPNPYRKEL